MDRYPSGASEIRLSEHLPNDYNYKLLKEAPPPWRSLLLVSLSCRDSEKWSGFI
jgi:hypothetical protein